MANLLTSGQLNEGQRPCQSLVSLSWGGGLYERVSGRCKS